ncbi:MAG: hypothetical protein IJ787_00715 [Bacilli bacterium]|nr:hypothetical protein [Bacilli bacterium]
MNQLLTALRRNARKIILVCLCVYGLLQVIWTIGNMSGGNVGTILGGLLYLLCLVAIIGVYVYAEIKDKPEVRKTFGLIWLSYVALSSFFALYTGFQTDGEGINIAQSIFGWFSFVCGMALFAYFLLGVAFPKVKSIAVLSTVSIFVLCGYAVFSFIEDILRFVYYCMEAGSEYSWVQWYYFLGPVASIAFVAVVIFFYILYVAAPAEDAAPAPIAEEALSKDEPRAEEKPAEEPKPEE